MSPFKSGHTRTGSQRYKCKVCQPFYTPEPKPVGYPDQTKREAVGLSLEGTNFRRICCILGVNHQSVVKRVNSNHSGLSAAAQSLAAWAACEARTPELMRAVVDVAPHARN